jgi:hypothetical protein
LRFHLGTTDLGMGCGGGVYVRMAPLSALLNWKRKMKEKKHLVTLTSTGYLRVGRGLLPDKAKERGLKFVIKAAPTKKTLELYPTFNGKYDSFEMVRRAMYPLPNSKSPIVACVAALKFIGVTLPKKSIVCGTTKKKDGTIVVQF